MILDVLTALGVDPCAGRRRTCMYCLEPATAHHKECPMIRPVDLDDLIGRLR
jgi:hypothetical protein